MQMADFTKEQTLANYHIGPECLRLSRCGIWENAGPCRAFPDHLERSGQKRQQDPCHYLYPQSGSGNAGTHP